jgi:hypothetical protein
MLLSNDIWHAVQKLLPQVEAILAETDGDRRQQLPLDGLPESVWASWSKLDESSRQLMMNTLALFHDAADYRGGTFNRSMLLHQTAKVQGLLGA